MQSQKNQAQSHIMQEFIAPPRKKKQQTQDNMQSLPFIPNKSLPRANYIRNQVQDAKQQILQMEAKINHLRKIREQNERRNQNNITKINFMNGVKDRVMRDAEQKEKRKRLQQKSLRQIKQKVQQERQKRRIELEKAKQMLQKRNDNDGQQQRRRHRQIQYLMQKHRQIQQNQNEKKVQIRRDQFVMSKINTIQNQKAKIGISKDNYRRKVHNSLEQKQKTVSMLMKLKEQQEKLMNDVKRSEEVMKTSRNQLLVLNPQKRHKKKHTKTNSVSQKHVKSDSIFNNSFQIYSRDNFESKANTRSNV